MTIYQGDQYPIPIIVERGGITQTAADISKLEIIFAGMKKEYPGAVEYNGNIQKFLFPLTQEESLELAEDDYDVLVRPYFRDGTIRGWKKAGTISVVGMEGAEML